MILRGVFAVVATYFYFLLFAQFAFLELVKAQINFTNLQTVMAAMGLAGLVSSLLSIKLLERYRAENLIKLGFICCGLCSLTAPYLQNLYSFTLVAALIGSSLAMLTVSLATALESFFPITRVGQFAGIGTGIAYFACNVPQIFNADLVDKSNLVSLVCFIAASTFFMKLKSRELDLNFNRIYPWSFIFPFLALVWFDSAAFFVIQQASELKALTWQGQSRLWSNAVIHLLLAVVAGFAIDLRYFSSVLIIAFVFLVLGVSALSNGYAIYSAPFYCAGVSLYSTALVVFPSLVSSKRKRSYWAGLLYALAGWFGSAMGIGMAQDLNRVPVMFILIAALIIVFTFKNFKKSLVLFILFLILPINSSAQTGREVYIQEGCINCHSQYVRPNSRDVEMWGPEVAKEKILAEVPPLIGNRRIGPDLLNVGNRRSSEWLELHMIYPQELSPGSRMPSYQYLFNDSRGKVLVEYLMSLGRDTIVERVRFVNSWHLKAEPITKKQAQELFNLTCAQCHVENSTARLLAVRPTNLFTEKYRYLNKESEIDLARAIKFGIIGTSMPGHEYFSDSQVLGLVKFLQQN